MVFPKEENLVYNVKISSVGPGWATGTDVVHEASGVDLAMKLHYLNGVYVFSSQAAQGLTLKSIKEAMFTWLNHFYMTCGRLRRSESGRPYVKCNDCGARFVEAESDKTVDELVEMMTMSTTDQSLLHKLLVYHQPIGPELSFSPLIYIQVTQFKCGGMTLGLSWAHMLGDAFSASDYIKNWAQVVAGLELKKLPLPTKIKRSENPQQLDKEPLSTKRVNPVGDHWVTVNNRKMETFSFHLTATQISDLQSKASSGNDNQIPIFESICAVIWQRIAIIREGSEPKTVTICKRDPNFDPKNKVVSNSQMISAVEAEFSVMDADLKELAELLVSQAIDERTRIEEAVERDDGVSDFIVYGGNLTFVDLESANLFGVELNGHLPEFVYYNVQGVGDEGVVLVLPAGPESSEMEIGEGRFVTLTLPEDQVSRLKAEFKSIGLLVEDNLE